MADRWSPVRPLPGSRSSSRRRRGFTLIETALTTIIVGVGVLAIVSAQQAFHQKNTWSTHASIAMQLGNEIREMTLNLPRHDPVTGTLTWGPEANELWIGDYDDLDDFDNWAFSAADGSGPINARREIIPDMDGWSQEIYVTNVDPFDIASDQPDGSTQMMRVRVVVKYQPFNEPAPLEMTTVSWVAPK
ncbi:MAG: type IV pilus modification PilV family protein [Planctomycetota bacterium]|jgi:prepilin-type N-terminal cleavage/methylation domain-containing protein